MGDPQMPAVVYEQTIKDLYAEIERRYKLGYTDGWDACADATDAAIANVRKWYDESIFPPRPKGRHTEVYDGEAAAVARMTCDNITRELDEAQERSNG
jgi:hypothetical protein